MLRQIALGSMLLAALSGNAHSQKVWAQQDNETARRRPGAEAAPALPPIDPNAVPPPTRADVRESMPIPDRWRLVDAVGVKTHWWDPYNQNTLKGDRPLFDDWFINVSVVSDTVYELRGLPVPVGPTSGNPNSIDQFGRVSQDIFVQTIIPSLSFIKGDTAFRPPDYEIRLTPAFNFNRVNVDEERILRIDPLAGHIRTDAHATLQEGFIDYHIRNVSDRFDFDSVRIGIQPVNLDFRGFLFNDQTLGIRFFGNRDNNHWQYNAGWFRRLEKDTNSGLNDLGKRPRDDDLFFVNLYRQDLPVIGYQIQGLVAYNRNREGNDAPFYNKNGFLERPASIGFERPSDYDAVYVGFNGDGHFGRFNLTHSFYGVFGNVQANAFTSRTRPESASIRAFFGAVEPSIDFDWIRVRGQALYATGDGDPFDNTATGFDAVFENPQFAGAETSYWVRQPVPLVGGGGLSISGRNGILNSLRTSKEQGQSNFINPGTMLLGAGADFDVYPELRVSANVNHLWFDKKAVVETLRNQPLESNAIGWDVSLSSVYRPTFIQNVAFRASGAVLFGGKGFRSLFDTERGKVFYSGLFNLILTY
ncbi:MAG: DUF429 domain-containing protein [Rhodospirillaceae bacterium]|nr:DUF429 domain-containing protein [Rhodospirillaceae bacterium]